MSNLTKKRTARVKKATAQRTRRAVQSKRKLK